MAWLGGVHLECGGTGVACRSCCTSDLKMGDSVSALPDALLGRVSDRTG